MSVLAVAPVLAQAADTVKGGQRVLTIGLFV
ncbi:MAG: hypothetical protein JWN17_2308, partial [Frankiales bacterium]|nr:hypothetical protein [Frankiales bacterium]